MGRHGELWCFVTFSSTPCFGGTKRCACTEQGLVPAGFTCGVSGTLWACALSQHRFCFPAERTGSVSARRKKSPLSQPPWPVSEPGLWKLPCCAPRTRTKKCTVEHNCPNSQTQPARTELWWRLTSPLRFCWTGIHSPFFPFSSSPPVLIRAQQEGLQAAGPQGTWPQLVRIDTDEVLAVHLSWAPLCLLACSMNFSVVWLTRFFLFSVKWKFSWLEFFPLLNLCWSNCCT